MAFKTLWLVWPFWFAALGNDSNDTGAARRSWDLPCNENSQDQPQFEAAGLGLAYPHMPMVYLSLLETKGAWNSTKAATATLKSLREFYF